MKNLTDDIKAAFLGATGGLFSFSVFLLVARVDSYYAYLSCQRENNYADFCGNAENLLWTPLCVWHVLLSVVASLMVHHYLPALRNSPFLLWQTVGITTGVGWLLSFCIAVGLDCMMNGQLRPIEHALMSAPYGDLAKYISVALACNVLFGSAMLAATTRHVAEDPQ
ncbi:MAG TPA: hypothetical protein VJV03_13250 [Pyrinomonadaceae bacterium]|nr:hypothetical protein [Pyrinomonadaceae bacterium]